MRAAGLLVCLTLAWAVPAEGKRRPGKRITYPDCSVQLLSGDGIEVKHPDHAFGTEKTVVLFREAVRHLREREPAAPPVVVGDLSRHGGGWLRPHRSHRDGRDIDVGYFWKVPRQPRHFAKKKPKQLDVALQWAFFQTLMATGQVEYLFVSYPLQQVLHAYVKKLGASKRDLDALFQWPRPRREKTGLIRFEPGHHDHFHVRFTKDPGPNS